MKPTQNRKTTAPRKLGYKKKDYLSSHVAKKSLGQNFLVKDSIRDRIIRTCNIQADEVVLEIGPGKGVLTEEIAKYAKQVIAIETDRSLAPELQKKFKDSNVTIIEEDILQFDFASLPDNVKIISNLPYNIATPIIEKVIDYGNKFTYFFMTVQLEYGLRLVAKPHTKPYGTFGCYVQYYTEPKVLFKIDKKAFRPIPKVQSCFLSLEILKQPRLAPRNEKLFFQIIHQAFSHRRKIIENSLCNILPKDELKALLDQLGLSSKLRAENLSLEEFLHIADAIEGQRNKTT